MKWMILEKDNKLWMVVGTPGGSTIITSVLQTILNVYEFNMGMQESVNQPRLVLNNGKLEAGADPRGDDTAVGF